MKGISLDDGLIYFNLQRKKSFNQGQMYVALSRIRRIEKMFPVGNYNRAAIKVNLMAEKNIIGCEKKVSYKPYQLRKLKRTR